MDSGHLVERCQFGSCLASDAAALSSVIPELHIVPWRPPQLLHTYPHTTNECGFICENVCIYMHAHTHTSRSCASLLDFCLLGLSVIGPFHDSNSGR